jgi:hypothetical protein
MAGTRQGGMTDDVLDRIVALLLALADLAERAAGVSDARRRLVLAIIRSGQAAAHGAFCVSAHAAPDRRVTPGVVTDCPRDSADDAMALAASLRVLALIVQIMAAARRRLALLPRFGARDRNGRGSDRHRLPSLRPCAPAAFPRARLLDTS